MANYHKLEGLSQQKFIISQFWKKMSEIKVQAEKCSFQDSRGESIPCLSLSLWCHRQFLAFPGLQLHFQSLPPLWCGILFTRHFLLLRMTIILDYGLPLMTPSWLIISAPFVQGRSHSQVAGFKALAYILEDTIQPTLQIMRKMFSFKSVLFTFCPKKLESRSLK